MTSLPSGPMPRSLSRRRALGLGAVGALALTGCSGTGGGAEQGGDPNQLSFWSNHPGSSKEVEQQLIDAFQEQSDGITVTLVDGGKNYEEVAQKFNAALSGGTVPDIVVVSDVTWFNFALNQQLTPIEDVAEQAGLDVSDYVEPLYEDYAFSGKHFALPYSRSTPLFYYNKDAWSAAGLPDQGPESWEQLREWADDLKASGGIDLPMVLPNGSAYLDWLFQGTCWSMGGAYSKEFTATFEDPNTLAAGELLKEFKSSGNLDVSGDPAPVFTAGQAACLIESTGSLQGVLEGSAGKFEVGTAFLPGPEGQACPTGGAGLAIPAKLSEERKVNALKAIAFLTGTESTVTFSQATGYMPVRTSAVESEETAQYLEKVPQAKTALDQLPHTHPQDAARVFVAGGGQEIGGALDKIVQGDDVASVFGALQESLQPKLDALAEKAK